MANGQWRIGRPRSPSPFAIRASPSRQQLALQLQEAALDVVQRLVEAVDLALDLGGIARAPLLARHGGKLDETGEPAARAVDHPPQHRLLRAAAPAGSLG